MVTIGLLELRRRWFDVVAGLARGEAYQLTHEGRPFAQLTPFVPPEARAPALPRGARPVDAELYGVIERLNALLGADELAAALSGTPAFIARAAWTGVLAPDLLPRIDFLMELLEPLVRRFGSDGMGHWVRRSRRELRGRSVLMTLRGAWRPEDPLPQRVQALVQQACAGREGTPSGERRL